MHSYLCILELKKSKLHSVPEGMTWKTRQHITERPTYFMYMYATQCTSHVQSWSCVVHNVSIHNLEMARTQCVHTQQELPTPAHLC